MTKALQWFRTHPPGCCLRTLESFVMTLNTVLMVSGVCMTAYAVYVALSLGVHLPGSHTVSQALGAARHAFPWVLYAFALAGIFITLTAGTALIGKHRRSSWWLSVNFALMSVAITLQVCLAVAFCVDSSWPRILPPDASGQYDKLRHLVRRYRTTCRWLAMAVLLLQVLTALVNCALGSAYSRAEEAYEDEEEEEAWRRRPLLASK